MSRLNKKNNAILRRKTRVKQTIKPKFYKHRLSVYISNMHIIAQIIDDENHKTLVHVSTIGSKTAKGTMTEKATWVGEQIATEAKKAKINKVVFDRGSKLYHGRIKALATAARSGGLEF